MMSAEDLDMGSFWSESLNVLIFFGSDRSFDVNPVGAESTFSTILQRKPHQHFLRFWLSLHNGMLINDVLKFFVVEKSQTSAISVT